MRLLLAAFLLALPLAGCFGGDGGDGPTTTAPSSSPTGPAPPRPPPGPVRLPLLLDFDFNGCTGLSVLQPQPLPDIQSLLPEPFVAAPFTLVEGVAEDRGVLAVDMFLCAELATPGTRLPATYYGQLYTFVERPAELVPDAPEGAQEYVFRLLAGEDVLALVWPAAGYDTHNGSASLSVMGDPAPARAAQAMMGSYQADAAVVDSPASTLAIETPFARYTRLADGSLLYWNGTYAFPAGWLGLGDYTVPDDDLFAPFRSPAGNLGGMALVYPGGRMEDNRLVRIIGL